MTFRASQVLWIPALALTLLFSGVCFADSQVRIVRLSSVDGDIRIDRNTGAGFEKAFLNLPITQGVKLKTGSDGRAEVEFEDGSTLRLPPGALLEFSELTLHDSGAKTSHVKLQQGTVYTDFHGRKDKDKDDEFTLSFARETVSLKDAVHFRVQLKDADLTIAVFKGSAKVQGASGEIEIGKNQSVTFDLANHDQYASANKVEDDPFDTWDMEQGKYHDKYMSNKSYPEYSSNSYGASDLNYYGNYFNAPGYGTLWQPYFVGIDWDPFMDGGWAYSPGYGYTWVSGYQWGWSPYHCGGWLFVPSFGWAWQPGACTGWYGFPRVISSPTGFRAPQPPGAAPGSGTIVMRPRPIISALHGSNRIVIQNNSAGLGIPRGGIQDLAHFSSEVKQNGSVTTSFHAIPVVPAHGMSNPTLTHGSSVKSAPKANSMPAGSPAPMGMPRSTTPHGTTKK
jgi:hypothetical protein